jgi:hypothetical protein
MTKVEKRWRIRIGDLFRVAQLGTLTESSKGANYADLTKGSENSGADIQKRDVFLRERERAGKDVRQIASLHISQQSLQKGY